MVLAPSTNQGNYFGEQSRHSSRFQWIENWAPRTLRLAGEHRLQVGSVVGHAENEGSFEAQSVQIQGNSGQLMQRIDFAGGKSYSVSDTEPAIYVQDHWVMTTHFALDAGIRMEAQTITHTFRTAPRTGFVWSPRQSGKTIVRGGVGVFYDSVPLDVYALGSYPRQLLPPTTHPASWRAFSSSRMSHLSRLERVSCLSIGPKRAETLPRTA